MPRNVWRTWNKIKENVVVLRRHCEVSVHNKLLLHWQVLKPMWIYDVPLFGCTKKFKNKIIQTFTEEVLRSIVDYSVNKGMMPSIETWKCPWLLMTLNYLRLYINKHLIKIKTSVTIVLKIKYYNYVIMPGCQACLAGGKCRF